MWKALLLASLIGFSAHAAEAQKVEVSGKLKTGVVAIGGETTGVTVEAKDGTYELDLGKDEALNVMVADLNGKMVQVTGTLETRKGVEGKERKVIVVSKLEREKKANNAAP